MIKKIKTLLKAFAEEDFINDFYFIGGSALTFYLNHRISYDIDLISTKKLDFNRLLALNVKLDGRYIPDLNESMFRINRGEDLKKYKMMFNIQEIKAEFFYPNDPVRLAVLEKYKNNFELIEGVKVLSLKGVAELKLLALLRRNKIRDLFDVFVLLDKNILDIDTIDKYSAMEYDKTFVEYIENFKDDGSESLDFSKENEYSYFANIQDKENILKEKIIRLYLQKVSNEQNHT
jgi:predicted nucleotidyltransferase component of viral defense system